MTDALYLSDAYLKESTSKIGEVGETPDHLTYLILDKTIFYPQGGGQPSDKGTIVSKSAILTVKQVEYNGGEIKHIGKSSGTFQVGDDATLTLNWSSRYEHMQIHSAGHILDMIARDMYPDLVPVKGMHGIGKQNYIEYSGEVVLDQSALDNRLADISKNSLTITTHFTTLEELKKIANWLPDKLPTSKKLRVLSIGDSYHIPDGGTQLKNTGEVWPIRITKIMVKDGNTQIHYAVADPKTKHASDAGKSNSPANNDFGGKIAQLGADFKKEIVVVAAAEEVESLRIKYLGKSNGLTTKLLQELPALSSADKKTYGPELNKLKHDQEQMFESRKMELKTAHKGDAALDFTVPGIPYTVGRLHPTTTIIREMNSFFRRLGFSIGEGPEIETAEYNFRRLGVPEGHPATDLQDSLFIKEPDILLRTHTSSIETRVLSSFKPPMRVVVPGKCFRNETTNLTNSAFFFQYQGFVVDKGISIANLKDTLTRFHQFLFGADVKLRFRYKYYPEVSPGMGVDYQCPFCHGDGCQVCKGRGWIEALGSGMIHVNTLRACGIDPEVYSGFAFGMGLDRLVMSKYGISDIRKLYGGEIVYT